MTGAAPGLAVRGDSEVEDGPCRMRSSVGRGDVRVDEAESGDRAVRGQPVETSLKVFERALRELGGTAIGVFCSKVAGEKHCPAVAVGDRGLGKGGVAELGPDAAA